jgi:hypothetical protein
MQRTLCEPTFTSPHRAHKHSPPFTTPQQNYCFLPRRDFLFLPAQSHEAAATTHQTATADTMPPDNIIASLKQGNALELEFIKKLKEGLDVIADGMQNECYKRGDALEELRETLEGVNLDEVSFVRGW